MAKIRTVEQLANVIDGDLAWRKRELTALSGALRRSTGIECEVLTRAAWTLLYAHWEGFVKESCTRYLEFVSSLGLTISQLSSPFAAVALRARIKSASSSNQGSAHADLIETARSGSAKAVIPYDSATVKTNANLKFSTYADIVASIGCSSTNAEEFQTAFDSMLLRHRNEIAHGRYMSVSQDDWEDLRGKVLYAMDDLRTQIQNGALTQGFLALGHTASGVVDR